MGAEWFGAGYEIATMKTIALELKLIPPAHTSAHTYVSIWLNTRTRI